MGEWEGTVVYSWKLFRRHSFITNNLFVLENDCDEMNTELRDMLKYQLLGANSYDLCRTMSHHPVVEYFVYKNMPCCCVYWPVTGLLMF